MTRVFHLHAPNGLSRHTLGCFRRAHTTGRKILATCQPSGFVSRAGRVGQPRGKDALAALLRVTAVAIINQTTPFPPQVSPTLPQTPSPFSPSESYSSSF